MITDISTIDIKRLTRRVSGISNRKKATIKEPSSFDGMSANLRMMDTYRQDWNSLQDFRERYQRNCKYHLGDQWSDKVEDDDGNLVTEETYIKEQGKIPLKQNIIRPLVKSLEGLFRSESGKSIVISRKPNSANKEKMLSNALQYALHVNNTREIDPRTFDIFLLSGLPVHKIGYDFISRYKRYDVMIDYIDPQYMFFNTDIQDVRLNDLRRIGQIHDVTIEELFVHFAKNDNDKRILRELYRGVTKDELLSSEGFSADRGENLDFFIPEETHKCRVIEVWEKRAVDVIEYWDKAEGEEGYWEDGIEELEAINNARTKLYLQNDIPEDKWALIHYDQTTGFKWFFKYMTPFGHILREGETPYDHGMHPFVMYPYPLINGGVWGIVGDIIDQQRAINRAFTLNDFVMGTSAKNTLFLDKNSLDGQDPADISSSYRQVGGVIVLDLARGAKMPQEISSNTNNLGITELIGLQMKLMQDISGVQPAMQGQTGSGSTPASKYAMEIQQTTLNNRDLMESFGSFRKDRDMKVLQTIIQFYKTSRYLAISGKDAGIMYDPEQLEGDSSEFDLVIGQSTDTPTYKGWIDEMLKDFVLNGMIDMEMFLTHSNLPFAEALLEDLTNKKEQVQNGQMSPQDATNGLVENFNQQEGVDPAKIDELAALMNKDAA